MVLKLHIYCDLIFYLLSFLFEKQRDKRQTKRDFSIHIFTLQMLTTVRHRPAVRKSIRVSHMGGTAYSTLSVHPSISAAAAASQGVH